MDQLGPLQKSLDSEALEFPGQKVNGNSGPVGALSLESEASELPEQKVNGNSGPAGTPTEKLRF